jgi:hypothetical protein
MKTPEWMKEVREWITTVAVLAIAVLAFMYLPDYLKRADAQRLEREALLKYVRETPPEEHIERVKKATRKEAAKERSARETGEK